MNRMLAMLLGAWSWPALAAVPMADFARVDGLDNAQISPDGKYAAFTLPLGPNLGLVVLDVATHKPVSKISVGFNGERGSVYSYAWASNKRLIVSLGDTFSMFGRPFGTGEMFAVDADGKFSTYLYGYRGLDAPMDTNIKHEVHDDGFADLVRTLPGDPDHVVIQTTSVHSINRDREHMVVYRLNIHNGKRDQNLAPPMTGPMDFAADEQGFVRFAIGHDEHDKLRSFIRSPDAPEWKPLLDPKGGAEATLLDIASDASAIYLASDEGAPRRCLVRQDLKTGERKQLSCDDVANVTGVVMSFDRREAIGAIYDAGTPSLRLLDTANPSRTVLTKLLPAFKGQDVSIVSTTLDGHLAIVLVSSDRNPGDYYVLDTQTLKADYLIGRKGWIDPDQMAQVKPVSFTARDGQVLHGFLTLPNGLEPRKLPLVVHPHGGPFGVFDTWEWDPDVQALASRGYAVLQVNFRGSGGYGQGFIDAGRQGWDHVMIDDITDGTRWAVAQGYADDRRLCIYGASYGGYAAIMSAIREPDLYRCVVSYAGVYDLLNLPDDSDVGATTRGQNFVKEFIGATPDKLRDASPLYHVDRLTAAVMIVHGKQDKRAPFSGAEALRDALDARKYPYEWLAKSAEYHGFTDPQHRVELFEKVQAFIDRNIGVPPASAPASH